MKDTKQSLRNLRVADVELFITASHMKSLGKSASIHHLSQSAASAGITRVESAFGLPLCTHEKRQFRLTREGQIILPRLESWLHQLRDLIVSEDQTPIRFVTTHAMAQVAVPLLLSLDNIEFRYMRPDKAYASILEGDADIALVLDNEPWRGVITAEIGKGYFQIYAKDREAPQKPILLPEEQMEVLSLKQSWQEVYGNTLPVKAQIPSWSLIANICSSSSEVGFLPDFLAKTCHLFPVSWQPAPSPYRLLALYRSGPIKMHARLQILLSRLRTIF